MIIRIAAGERGVSLQPLHAMIIYASLVIRRTLSELSPRKPAVIAETVCDLRDELLRIEKQPHA